VKSNWLETSESSDVLDLPIHGVHVWAVPLEVEAAKLRLLETRLAPDERLRAGRFLREEPRRNFVASRAALRAILGRYLDIVSADVAIAYGSNGKPCLADPAAKSGLKFNLAHSGGLGLVAVAQGCEIGVDVEMLRHVEHWQQTAARYFHPAETEAILAADPEQRNEPFLRCWTRKEAILKALGSGLGHSLDSFAVPVSASLDGWVELPAAANAPPTPSRFWLQSLDPRPGYLAVVAIAHEKREATGFLYQW
jgi:4'-phosphopantetheinyl transferase